MRAAQRRRPDPPAPAGFTIRDAVAGDMPHCRAIYNHYVENSTVTFDEAPLSHARMRAKFHKAQEHGWPWLVAVSGPTDDGEVLGYAAVSSYRDRSAYRYTVEDAIYLGPAATGRGIGSALLRELIGRAREAGFREIVAVIADQGAEASIALHERQGFKEIGRMGRVGFKFDRWLGTVFLQLSLRPSRARRADTRP
ncbi:MAG: N-acetyltransferase family protein [Micrococcales bacterium 73-13]|nr:MAG: N-acetyltransferase family protein [Micrococcales bacterium 73-13]